MIGLATTVTYCDWLGITTKNTSEQFLQLYKETLPYYTSYDILGVKGSSFMTSGRLSR